MKHFDIAAWIAAIGTAGGLILASYSGVFSLEEGPDFLALMPFIPIPHFTHLP